MKKAYIFLFIIFMFIVSCGNKITDPSKNIDDIEYYDPATAETKEYNFVRIDPTGAYIDTRSMFKKLAVSKNAIIYLEEGHNEITKNTIISFVKKFEEYYPKEIEIYGSPSDIDQNGKIIFLIASLNTNGPGTIGGYFNHEDLIYGKDNVKGEYLHVDPSVGEENYIFGVMMHELQHLINYYNNAMQGKAMDIWLNEGLSESTSHIFAKDISDSRLQSLNVIPYYSFYSWYFQYSKNNYIFGQPMDTFSYGPVSMFMKWIDIKTGGNQEIYKRIAFSTIADSEQRLVDSVKALNSTLGSDMDTLLFNWIKGINNGEIPDLRVDNLYYNPFIKNGQTLLLPRALIICSKEDADKITDPNVKKESLENGNWIVLNARKNLNPGYTSESDIVHLSLTTPKVPNSSYNNITELTAFKKGYFIDKVITEKDIIRK
uniref:hypothetical protein n=1 Tax=Brachyspira catarrhinii TaxID=2528966 RepID=UPI003F4B65A9